SIDFAHVAAVTVLCSQPEGSGRLQIPGVDVYRSFEWLRLAPPGVDNLENRNFRLPAPVPGSVLLLGECSAVLLEQIESRTIPESPDYGYNKVIEYLDGDRISGALEVRNWRHGDQYRPVGHSGVEKFKILFRQG